MYFKLFSTSPFDTHSKLIQGKLFLIQIYVVFHSSKAVTLTWIIFNLCMDK